MMVDVEEDDWSLLQTNNQSIQKLVELGEEEDVEPSNRSSNSQFPVGIAQHCLSSIAACHEHTQDLKQQPYHHS